MKVLKCLPQRIPLELGKNINHILNCYQQKNLQFSKPLKTTARPRNVIISSPPVNLVLVD